MTQDMERAIITMPYDLAMADELSRMQFWSRAQLIYKELEQARAALAAMSNDCADAAGILRAHGHTALASRLLASAEITENGSVRIDAATALKHPKVKEALREVAKLREASRP